LDACAADSSGTGRRGFAGGAGGTGGLAGSAGTGGTGSFGNATGGSPIVPPPVMGDAGDCPVGQLCGPTNPDDEGCGSLTLEGDVHMVEVPATCCSSSIARSAWTTIGTA